ncbi:MULTISPECIES: Imm40 family immunity protein [unclassified Granulicatella]|uniref:Imm40 family immunity protein n=1 Tax=unclassified Granulicatella TaxID=2630493 RepID=UPI0010745263|nr:MULTISPECIES: Imm40 family immunity protein [unclassified Granulicatella]MBF0780542.1 hypothetical protein [Granulicatella sp. 19428wC4_WM01]TFU94946.1 hypothetical protein E4T68_05475 [Granulicatella sp. WM01]
MIKDFLPQELYQKGVSLASLGMDGEYAWLAEDIWEVCEYLERNNRIILGGDVISYDGVNLNSTYDSWHVSREELNTLNILDYSKYSVNKAIDYITKYIEKNGLDYLYLLVISDLKLSNKI